MAALDVGEGIRVGAAFDKGRALPVWFRWRNRYYKVKAVNFTWTTNNGSGRVRHFAVTDGANSYEICFNSRTVEWTLEKVSCE